MDQLDKLLDAVVVTALLAFILIALVVVRRLALWLWDRTLRRGKLPMIIHVGARPANSSLASVGGSPADSGAAPPAADAAVQAGRLATEVRAYIEADSRVLLTPAPGGGNLTAPPAQTQVPDQPGQWLAVLLALATPAKRHYDAWIDTETVQGTGLRAYLEITRSPGDQLMVAEVVTAETMDELVEFVAGACLHHLRRQPAVRQRTPRWEQWHTREGYRQFRRGLELEDTLPEGSLGDATVERQANAALQAYKHACVLEPANLIPRLSRAQLLERWPGRRGDAIEIYRMCHNLWPENIETAYRLMAACINAQGQYDYAEEARAAIFLSLRSRVLLYHWAQTWLPNRLTRGERSYWASWLPWHSHNVTRPLVSERNKRRQFLAALSVCNQVIALLRAMSAAERPHPERRSIPTAAPDVLTVTTRLAELITTPGPAPALVRLFHRDLDRASLTELTEGSASGHSSDWHMRPFDRGAGVFAVTNINAGIARRHIGWLAHYNAACFLAIASTSPVELVPSKFSKEEWVEDCHRAAFRELSQVVRDPLSQLQLKWLAQDPNLESLRTGCEIGLQWKIYMGFPLWSPVEL